MKMEQTGCSETLAFEIQTVVNHPEESIRHLEQGEILKSRKIHLTGEETAKKKGTALTFLVEETVQVKITEFLRRYSP
jgi:hypothetical protein